ncbi:MAG: VWA domain-containing protein [Pseudomonadota bacterium]
MLDLKRHARLRTFFTLVCLPNLLLHTANASVPGDEEQSIEEIVVTGSMRVTAGGSQDINFARGAIARGQIPHPDDFTVEGLLSEYDLSLAQPLGCQQLFCLFTEIAHDQTNPRKPGYFTAIGFASNIDAKTWQRQPMNLVAVIDRSGSMEGPPLARVRTALLAMTRALNADDQLTIIVYGAGAHIHMPATPTSPQNLQQIQTAINAIASMGSTNMEAGLLLGLEQARASAARFQGTTRMMLFTDERPNVGRVDAASFMGIARNASAAGIGLSTFGVADHFDAKLATTISSVRGGNLFFLNDDEQTKTLFNQELDYLVSELAHDITIRLQPHPDWRIKAVYGVPNQLLSDRGERVMEFTIPTVFLSKRGGGVFVELEPHGRFAHLPAPPQPEELLHLDMTYRDASSGVTGSASHSAREVSRQPSEALQLARLLTTVHHHRNQASYAHHIANDQRAAHDAAKNALQLLRDTPLANLRSLSKQLHKELKVGRQLVDQLALFAGLRSERHFPHQRHLWGSWRIVNVRGDNWEDMEKGEILHLGPNRVLHDMDASINQPEWSDAEPLHYERQHLYFLDREVAARVRVRDDLMQLTFEDETRMRLQRLRLPTEEELPER